MSLVVHQAVVVHVLDVLVKLIHDWQRVWYLVLFDAVVRDAL